MFQKLCRYSKKCQDRTHHISESEQKRWAKMELPATKGGLVLESKRLSRVSNRLPTLDKRKRQIDEQIDRLTLEAEPKNGVFLTGPKITKGDSE